MNTEATNLQPKSSASLDKRYGRPQIIRILISSYITDLRESVASGKH